uniref:Uncharacterized protein n=1 Tax=Physcomitrium patens TaxID=3218 RepID=A0A2K1KP76_PHYPA|nr:hypothetical protein PHYPA_006481 [Physcomitrium patens]
MRNVGYSWVYLERECKLPLEDSKIDSRIAWAKALATIPVDAPGSRYEGFDSNWGNNQVICTRHRRSIRWHAHKRRPG